MPSPRIVAAVDALPLRDGMRVLEIGCGPGVAARLVLERMTGGHVLATDRSSTAIAQATRGSVAELGSGRLTLRQVAAEDLVLEDEEPFDLAFALRVGALDGRHPALGAVAFPRIRGMLTAGGRVFVDGVEV